MGYSLLLHLDGSNGDTTTVDNGPTGHAISLLSGAALSTAQIKFGATSLLLDGANDYASFPPHSDFIFGASGSFTIDFWTYIPSIPGTDKTLIASELSIYQRWAIKIKLTGAVAFELYNGSPVPAVNISGGTVTAATWAHIAVVRETSGTINLYLDGTSVGSASYAGASPGGATGKIGSSFYPSPHFLNAYFDEVRILKDEAAWTSNFTPPASAYAPLFDKDQEHGILYTLLYLVEQEHGILYGAWVEAEHGTPINLWTEQQHAMPYAPLIENEHGVLYSAWIEAEHGILITWLIEQEHGSLNSLLQLIDQEHGMPLDLQAFNDVEQDHGSLFGAWVEADHGLQYTLMLTIENEHGILFSSLTDVHQEHGSPLNLLSYNPIEQEHGILTRLGLADFIDVTDSAILYHNGRRIEILSADIKQDEGDPYWSGSASLAEASDYSAITIGDPVILQFGAISYNLNVETKEKTRSFGNVNLSLSLIGPAPATTPITKTWPAVFAKAAAEETIGAAIDWQISNWLIPDSRLAVVNAAPIDIARKITEAAGGVLQAKPDGTFKARPLFPVSVPSWSSASPDYTLTDDAHNITATELYKSTEIINAVTIRDTSGDSTQDATEYKANANDALQGVLYVWPRPWRPIDVSHTGHAAVGLSQLGLTYLEKRELVEFKAGRANVASPIYSISNIKWQYVNLGAVSFAENELTSTITGYSLAWITYLTRCYSYAVSDTIDETIQFLVMDK